MAVNMEASEGNGMKVCFTSSSGGHYEEMMMLKDLMDKFPCFVLTEKTSYSVQTDNVKTYYLKQVNRKEIACIPYMLINTYISFKVFIKERPDVIISTGVLATIPICLIGKLAGKKLIYIESYAKVTSASKTGSLMYRLANQFYVHWASMVCVYPNAIFIGKI